MYRHLRSKLESHHFSYDRFCPNDGFDAHYSGYLKGKLLFPFPLPHRSFYSAVKSVPFPRWWGAIYFVCSETVLRMRWKDISSLSPYLDVYTLAEGRESLCLFSKYIFSSGFPSWLFLTLGPFLFIASPSRQLYSYRAVAGHFLNSIENTKMKVYRITSDYWEPIFSIFLHVVFFVFSRW